MSIEHRLSEKTIQSIIDASPDPDKLNTLILDLFKGYQSFVLERKIWVSIPEYALKYGISEKTVYRAIEDQIITEENGGLAIGSSKPRARKKIHLFFDIAQKCVNFPF